MEMTEVSGVMGGTITAIMAIMGQRV